MQRTWLVIPARGVAIDIEGVLGTPRDRAWRQRLVETARERYQDVTVRLISGPSSSAYLRLEGEAAERLAELRGIRLSELRELEGVRRSRWPRDTTDGRGPGRHL